MALLIGYSTHDLAGSDGGNTNTLTAVKAVSSGAGTVDTVSFYVNTAAGNINLGLYADSGGEPGALLCSTGAFAAAGSQWNTRTTTTHPAVTATNYWVAFLGLSATLSFPANLSFQAGNARFIGSTTSMTDPWNTAGDTSSPARYELYASATQGTTITITDADPGTDGAGGISGTAKQWMIGSTGLWLPCWQ